MQSYLRISLPLNLCSFSEYLSTSFVPGIILSAKDTGVNKTKCLCPPGMSVKLAELYVSGIFILYLTYSGYVNSTLGEMDMD